MGEMHVSHLSESTCDSRSATRVSAALPPALAAARDAVRRAFSSYTHTHKNTHTSHWPACQTLALTLVQRTTASVCRWSLALVKQESVCVSLDPPAAVL